MEKITSVKELKLAIADLEADRVHKYELLKSQAAISLNPSSIISNIIGKQVKENLLDSVIGLLAGYVSKKVLVGSGNPLKNTFGTIIQMMVAGLVSNNTGEIKQKGMDILKSFFSSKEEGK